MRRRRGPLFLTGCGLLLAFAVVAAFAPLLVPYDPRLSTGPPLAPPNADHVLGTNDLGQDVLSQVVTGVRPSLLVAGIVTALSMTLSWVVGLSAGMLHRVEGALMGVTDLLLALPNIPLYLLVLTLLGPDQRNLILVLAFLSWPAFARVVRSHVLRTRSAAYVEASRMLGASSQHVIFRHVLPDTLDVLPANLVLTARFAIAAEATLAFLGLNGSDQISWGVMLSWAFADPLLFLRPVWPWLVLPPTLAIVVLMLAVTWVGGGLVDATTSTVRDRREPTDDRARKAVRVLRSSHATPAASVAGSG